jgi:hypothetical protein
MVSVSFAEALVTLLHIGGIAEQLAHTDVLRVLGGLLLPRQWQLPALPAR